MQHAGTRTGKSLRICACTRVDLSAKKGVMNRSSNFRMTHLFQNQFIKITVIRRSLTKVAYLFGLLVFTACSAQINDTTPELSGQLAAQELVATFGQVTNRPPNRYLGFIVERLNSVTLKKISPLPEVILLDTPALGAYSGAGHYIVLTRGLALALGSEGELAFVIAHEIAHRTLGHLEGRREWDDSVVSDQALKREMSADQYAFELIERAGFSAGSALQSVLSVSAFFPQGTPGRIALDQRATNLKELLRAAHPIIPAVTTSHDFRRFHQDLSYSINR